ncbi:hypothetical protein J4E80_003773 [Alternaria sp. BMP 0032]|nr:hypothetical protein J4E80_003773 [Alternaria sp. BMP 0032]
MKDELMEYFGVFQRLVCPVPVQTTKKEIEAFLSDARKNSQLYPTTLALLFGFIALGAQHSVWDKSGGRWNADAIEIETQKGNVYIAAAMQALRLMLDSFALFGTTIRLAHSIGLHRHPKYLNPAPTNEKDCVIRQKIWWHMLHLDEQMSMTLGRPLGISGIGDNPWPTELTTDPVSLRFGEFVNHFTILARQIMSSNRLTNARIDEYTDILRRLLDTIPETLQFRDTWMLPETTLPDLYAVATVYFSNAHTYIILLNQQKTEKHATSATISTGKDNVLPFQAVHHASSLDFSHETYSTQAAPRGRTLVLASSEALISAFLFFHYRDPAALIDWATAQQAFNGCMILLLDALECRTVTTGAFKAEQAFVVFKNLYENSVHELAGLAVEKLSLCLQELHRLVTLPSDVQSRGQRHTAMQGPQHNEATRASVVTDTVMGQTGMFLLEDMSQQTAANEVFSPMAWNNPDIATQAEEHRHAGLHRGGTYKKVATSPKDHVANARYTDGMQGLRRSNTLRSASTRYATLSEDDHMQPHGYTAPTSPADFSALHDHQLKNTIDHRGWQKSRGDESSRPLHLYTHFQKLAASGDPQQDMVWHHDWSYDVSGEIQERRSQSSAWPQRHNSCPAVPPVSAHPPILRPAFSSPDDIDRPTMERRSLNTPITSAEHTPFNVSESFSRVVETNPRAPFTPHRAAPLQMSSIAEATPGFSPTVLGGFYGQQGQIRSQVVTYPSTIAASSSLTPMTENMNMNDWNRYAGSEGLD